jgi:uncharacterized damage-inducible protein DinB
MPLLRIVCASALLSLLAVPASAQTPAAAPSPANPVTASLGAQMAMIKANVTKAAAQVPETLYAFKATPEVRSFGQLFGHIADANHAMCATAAGEKMPEMTIEKTRTAKADLQTALAESFAYCERVLAATTDANGGAMHETFGFKMARLAWLSFAVSHDFEHYGNIVTYMRLNKMVPPSSQRMK